MSNQTKLKIEHVFDKETDKLHVEMISANEITFDINLIGIDYIQAVADVCAVAPHMMALDSDLAEAYDNAFRTQPKAEDKITVGKFIHKYRAKLPSDFMERFR